MKYENILVATNEKITIITINRPDKLNALNMLTIEELHVALDNLSKDESCKELQMNSLTQDHLLSLIVHFSAKRLALCH